MTPRAPLTPALVDRRLSELQQLARLGTSLAEAELPPVDRRVLERRSLLVVGRAPHVSGKADVRDVRLHVAATAIDRHLGWMPDAWLDPVSGEIIAVGLTVLVAAFVGDRRGDALPRGHDGTITLRFLTPRPACVDGLPVLERSDHSPRLWLCASRDRARTRW